MKKFKGVLLLILALFFLFGCHKQNSSKDSSQDNSKQKITMTEFLKTKSPILYIKDVSDGNLFYKKDEIKEALVFEDGKVTDYSLSGITTEDVFKTKDRKDEKRLILKGYKKYLIERKEDAKKSYESLPYYKNDDSEEFKQKVNDFILYIDENLSTNISDTQNKPLKGKYDYNPKEEYLNVQTQYTTTAEFEINQKNSSVTYGLGDKKKVTVGNTDCIAFYDSLTDGATEEDITEVIFYKDAKYNIELK